MTSGERAGPPEAFKAAVAAPAHPGRPRWIHVPHPHSIQRAAPRKTEEHHHEGLSGWLAVRITALVSTMTCAGLFAALALIGLPSALQAGVLLTVVWLSSTFLQLVFLPILALGQKVAARQADEAADVHWKDVSAVLHEALQIQQHLAHQDEHLAEQDARLERIIAHFPLG
jgi:hypothetical protein